MCLSGTFSLIYGLTITLTFRVQTSRYSLDVSQSERGCTVDLLFVQEFDVYFAQSNAALYEKISTGDTAWCGIERLVSGHRHKCSISTTPFQTTFVAVVPSLGRDVIYRGMPHRTNLHYILCPSCGGNLAACKSAHSPCMLM